jgi:hypothetical protein
VDDPGADHGGERGDVPDLAGGDGGVVVVEDQQVGEEAGPGADLVARMTPWLCGAGR